MELFQRGCMDKWRSGDFFSYLKKLISVQELCDLLRYWPILVTLIMPKPKVICLCHQYRARSACTYRLCSVQSDQQLQVFILIFLNMIGGSSKNVRWLIIFKNFGIVRFLKKAIDIDYLYQKKKVTFQMAPLPMRLRQLINKTSEF